MPASGAVDFESRAKLAVNYLERTVDPVTGQPYFDVFDGSPVELFHDWPDFGDLSSRYWEAALMIRDMTGVPPANLNRLRELTLSYFDSDGFSYRPLTAYSSNVAEMFDQSRTMYALCSAYMADPDAQVKSAIIGIIDGLISVSTERDGYRFIPGCRYKHGEWEEPIDFDNAPDSGYYLGPLLRPLVKAWELTGYQPALDLAVDLCRFLLDKARILDENGRFEHHVHSKLSGAAGVFVCGKASGNVEWVRLARLAWEYARELAGPCGFVPEVLNLPDHPVFRSETCGIMDYLELTLLLALDGDESKWGDAEKIVRNHLIESQLTGTHWAESGQSRPETSSLSEMTCLLACLVDLQDGVRLIISLG